MIYSSLMFIYGFLPVSLLIYYLTPKKHQPLVLLLLSAVFCGMLGLHCLVFTAVFAGVNYVVCRTIESRRENRPEACTVLCGGIFFDVFSLFLFRSELLSALREGAGIPESFFPLGVSFMVLGGIGTLADVYTGRLRAERNFLRFWLYFIFFPRLIMGPLLRYGSFSKVLDSRKPELAEIGAGMTIFVKGLAKKVLAADTLYLLYEAVRTTDVGAMSALTAWLGALAYILCLYFTLSGLADMGTGAGYCFGLRMPQSFNYPLFSIKIRYFAARWHIQVVQWMRRYITKTASSRFRSGIVKKLIFICVWGILGFWYVFSINGLIWGILIGMAITAENRLSRGRILNVTGGIYTAFAAMVFGVFLSGESISYSLRYLWAMIGGAGGGFADAFSLYLLKAYVVVLLITMYAATDLFRNMMVRSGKNTVKTALTAATPLVVLALLTVCTALMSYTGSSEMILIKL
ncbi:MAG: hypothetical protein IKO47_01545 [Ruminococcus sp.]|nr:hypothetical protein [Ruminococcus sp.]